MTGRASRESRESHPGRLAVGVLLAALVFARQGAADGFDSTKYPMGANPQSVAVADVDGDSIPDVVTANSGGQDLSIRLGAGDGTLQAQVKLFAGADPLRLAVADLDGDLRADLVVSSWQDFVHVSLGSGGGSFQAPVSYPVVQPYFVAIADLDGDEIPDLVITNSAGSSVSVLLGNGDGSFGAAVSCAAGDGPAWVAVADLDGDTVPDLATANSLGDRVGVLLGNGDGSFQAPTQYLTGDYPSSVAVDDLDGDSIPDLSVANTAVADVDGDGLLDVLTADTLVYTMSLLLGDGNGAFAPPLTFATGFHPRAIATADL